MIIIALIAFAAGILTAFTPCALPILPVVLASGLEKRARTIGTIVGLVTLFVVVTLTLSSIVSLLGVSADSIRNASMVFLLAIGFLLIFPDKWAIIQHAIERRWRIPTLGRGREDFAGGFLTGASLGVVWTPCVGPVVAAVTALTASSETSGAAIIITSAYGLGIGLSLWVIALGGKKILDRFGFVKTKNSHIRQWFGVIIVLTALSILVGLDRSLQTWTLKNLPESWTQAGSFLQDSDLIRDKLDDVRQGSEEKNQSKNGKITEDDLDRGCPRRDCIPSIDNPKFESASSANKWLQDDDIVFGAEHNGVARAYSQRILNWHEIVNDTIGGKPVVITFCPLCGSSVAFDRMVGGKEVEFGVSGYLYNSNLVMYDRDTDSLWQQVGGEAIVGEASERNEILKPFLLTSTSWKQWKSQHPDTQVLSRDTGFTRDYDVYPYGGYEENGAIYFGIQNSDDRLKVKEVVHAFDIEGSFKVYTEEDLKPGTEFEDTIGDHIVQITRGKDGAITALDKQTQVEYVPLRTFWFAWAAFHPNTEIYAEGK